MKSCIALVMSGVLWYMISNPMASAATLKASYFFNDTLSAAEGGAPALTAIDPLGLSSFETATVFGNSRRVWRFDGAVDPATDQGGLTLPTSGLLTPNSYSVEVIALWFDRGVSPGAPGWRHITDVEDRTSDNGFYVNPNDNLELYPVDSGTTPYDINEFRHVVLTVSSSDNVRAYLDGTLEFSNTTSITQIDNANNPSLLMHFFVDDTTSGFVNDWAEGQVALIRVWDGVLSASAVGAIAADPFGVPEPSSLVLLSLGGVITLRRRDCG